MELEEKEKFIESALGRMAWHTWLYVARIIRVDGSPRHVGTGFRVSLAGRQCILTAAHVVEQARDDDVRFAVMAVRDGPPYRFERPPDHVDRARDLAIYFLPQDDPEKASAVWPGARVDIVGDKLATDFLFIHGFPTVPPHLDNPESGLAGRSLPYGAMLRTDDLPEDLEPSQFAVDFDITSMRGAGTQRIDLLDPRGLCGSPVWRIGASGLSVDDWSPDLSLIVGVITHWQPDKKILVATRWRDVLEMVEPP